MGYIALRSVSLSAIAKTLGTQWLTANSQTPRKSFKAELGGSSQRAFPRSQRIHGGCLSILSAFAERTPKEQFYEAVRRGSPFLSYLPYGFGLFTAKIPASLAKRLKINST